MRGPSPVQVHIQSQWDILLSNNYGVKPPWGWSASCKENPWNRCNCPFLLFFFSPFPPKEAIRTRPAASTFKHTLNHFHFPNFSDLFIYLFTFKMFTEEINTTFHSDSSQSGPIINPPPLLLKHIMTARFSRGATDHMIKDVQTQPPPTPTPNKNTHTQNTAYVTRQTTICLWYNRLFCTWKGGYRDTLTVSFIPRCNLRPDRLRDMCQLHRSSDIKKWE